jgi:hypothetical protein
MAEIEALSATLTNEEQVAGNQVESLKKEISTVTDLMLLGRKMLDAKLDETQAKRQEKEAEIASLTE